MDRIEHRQQEVARKIALRQQSKKATPTKPKGSVALQLPFTAVKLNHAPGWSPGEWVKSFDIWQWNIFKQKWVRLSNTACGYGSLSDAKVSAQQLSDEVETAIRAHIDPAAIINYPRPI